MIYFQAYRIIQRMVTSNPSPRYVEVVATAFATGSYGGRKYSVHLNTPLPGSRRGFHPAPLASQPWVLVNKKSRIQDLH